MPGAPAALVELRCWFWAPDQQAVVAALPEWLEPRGWRSAPSDPDWERAWQEQHPAQEVAPGWTIAAPWAASPGALLIEPGQGFGTGQHPTTRAALRLLIGLGQPTPGAALLDVGCGSGVLTLAGARLGYRARGIDIEAEAVTEAARNAQLNGLEAAFEQRTLAPYDRAQVVVANLDLPTLSALAEPLLASAGAHLIVSGLREREPDDLPTAFSQRFALAGEERLDGWVALRWATRLTQ